MTFERDDEGSRVIKRLNIYKKNEWNQLGPVCCQVHGKEEARRTLEDQIKLMQVGTQTFPNVPSNVPQCSLIVHKCSLNVP